MSKLLFFIGFAIVAIASSARITRDTPKHGDGENLIDALKNGLTTLGDNILKTAGATDANDLQKKALAQWDAAEDKIKVWINSAQKETEHIKENPLVVDLNNALEKLGSDFKTAHPGLTNGVSEEVKKASDNIDEVVKKMRALENSEQTKQMKETTAKLIESAKAQLGSLAKDLQEKAKSI